jgi:F-type H+-transporting ATPase subunit epsilon
MHVYILTPEKTLYDGNARSVKVPGTLGQFEILDKHAPIVSSLIKGQVQLTDTNGQKHQFEITRGFVEVMTNEVNVLVRQA